MSSAVQHLYMQRESCVCPMSAAVQQLREKESKNSGTSEALAYYALSAAQKQLREATGAAAQETDTASKVCKSGPLRGKYATTVQEQREVHLEDLRVRYSCVVEKLEQATKELDDYKKNGRQWFATAHELLYPSLSNAHGMMGIRTDLQVFEQDLYLKIFFSKS